MDLLFVLIFAFMLQTAGDAETRVQEKSSALQEELEQLRLQIVSLDSETQKSSALQEELEQARIEITNLGRQQKKSSALQEELEQARLQIARLDSEAQKSSVLQEELRQVKEKVQGLSWQPPKVGKWRKEYSQLDKYITQEEFIEEIFYLTALPEKKFLPNGREVLAYSARAVISFRRGKVYENLSGFYDTEVGVLHLKTQGWVAADGQYQVARNAEQPLGYVRLLNANAARVGWVIHPTDVNYKVSRNGEKLLYGLGSNTNADLELTRSSFESSWISAY